MAKYTITFNCGHSDVRQIYGPTKRRESLIEWLEGQPCPQCQKEKRNREYAERSLAARMANEKAGYAVLTGSEKQIAWAECIRREAISLFSKFIDRVPEDAREMWSKTHNWLGQIESSKWWIDSLGSLNRSSKLPIVSDNRDDCVIRASDRDVLMALLLASPFLDEKSAKALGIWDVVQNAKKVGVCSKT